MRVDLTSGAYVGRSIIENDQRCINLFPEAAPGDSPFPTVHYPAPGLVRIANAPEKGWRGLYKVRSTGELYGVCGQTVYYIAKGGLLTFVGTIGTSNGAVSMTDNGYTVLIVDGSSSGYTIDIPTRTFEPVADANFYGANRVDVADTYFIANRPDTQQYYISLTNQAAWDALDVASKSGSPDKLVTHIVMHNELWLFGQTSTEVHYNAGAADFTYARMPGVFINHGCMAPLSPATYDQSVYWLSQSPEGRAIVMRGNNYTAERISTHAIEAELSKYADMTDAMGHCFQMGGHTFYQLTFPTGDATWVFDEATKLWHQRASIDGNGKLHRHRATCFASAYGQIVCGDYADGRLYVLDLDTYSEDGQPTLYLRTFPHIVKDGKRCTYQRFIADMEVGNVSATRTSEGLLLEDGTDLLLEDGTPLLLEAGAPVEPQVMLRWSDDRGVSFGNGIPMSLGKPGEYKTSLQWWGLGMARDRVFELSWSATVKTALNGAFVEFEPHAT